MSMSSRAIAITDLSILQELQQKGVKFSAVGEAIIAKKSRKSIGFISEIGIALKKFTEFLYEIFNKSIDPFDYNLFARDNVTKKMPHDEVLDIDEKKSDKDSNKP
jgi:hypothetical protein